MTHVRILSILAPRMHQLLQWTVDPNSLAEPLLKKEEIPTLKQHIVDTWRKMQDTLYQPPPYSPPRLDPKLKG
jgi:hypothetical protein